MPSVTAGVGILGCYMDATRDAINETVAWQDWAGIDYLKRIHYTENRDELENGASFVRTIENNPFANIWIPSVSVEVLQCLWDVAAFVLFQADATKIANHDESAIQYMNSVGQIMEQLVDVFSDGKGRPVCTEIAMVSEPFRVPAQMSGDECDFWTSTIGFKYG